MIFAVLGTIILIVSFVIALYSLIKEQNQFGDSQEEVKDAETPKTVESVESELEAVKKPDVVINKRPRDTFIWDQHLPKEAEQVSKIDEEKEIKEIEARLAQIKSEASQGLKVSRQQMQTEQVLPRSNLSGEFTIGDMLKEGKDLT